MGFQPTYIGKQVMSFPLTIKKLQLVPGYDIFRGQLVILGAWHPSSTFSSNPIDRPCHDFLSNQTLSLPFKSEQAPTILNIFLTALRNSLLRME